MNLRRSLLAYLLLLMATALAAPAFAQMPAPYLPPAADQAYAGGWQGSWVGQDGQIYHADQAAPPSDAPAYIDRSITPDDWLDGCQHRLDLANQGRDGPASYGEACAAWLHYYEQTGYARQGYGFSYAIPVSVTVEQGICTPCPPEYISRPKLRRHLIPARPMHDKRIRL
jgi:hypothetical protein